MITIVDNNIIRSSAPIGIALTVLPPLNFIVAAFKIPRAASVVVKWSTRRLEPLHFNTRVAPTPTMKIQLSVDTYESLHA
jgi:hypothetical protein